jgi:hypothetical protein
MGVGAENIDKEKKSILCIAFYIKNNFSFRSTIGRSRCFWLLKLRMTNGNLITQG